MPELKVSTSLPVTFEKIEDIPDSRFTRVKCYIVHIGGNLNGSFFSREVIEEMAKSLANIPISGYIKADKYSEIDFSGHEERLIVGENGFEVKYYGSAYGLIGENHNAHFEMRTCDDGIEREFLVCDGIIWNKFTDAAKIFDRDEVKSQSMELNEASISGNFEKDKLFHFKTAIFDSLCVLGGGVSPGIISSTIEKFSQSTIKEQLREMILEYSKFSLAGDETASANNSTIGNVIVIESNIDPGSTLEIPPSTTNEPEPTTGTFELVVEPVNELEGGIALKKKILNKDFTLTSEQLESELRSILAAISVVTDDYGYSYSEFYLIDYLTDVNVAIAQSWVDYNIYGFDFTVNGDKIEIDISSKKRFKVDYVPMDLSDAEPDEDDVATNFSALVDHKNKQKEAEVEKRMNAEFELRLSDSLNEVSAKLGEAIIEFSDLQSKYTALEVETNDLKQFKLNQFAKEHDEAVAELFTNFSTKLTEEDMADIKAKSSEMEVEQIENSLMVLFAKKNLNFSFTKPKERIVMGIPAADTSVAGDITKDVWTQAKEKFDKQ